MTEAEALEKQQQRKSSNGNVFSEAIREDVFDHTYREKEGPKPAKIIVWKNVLLMTILHLSAAYAVFLIPSASRLTLLWCKYNTYLLLYFCTGRLWICFVFSVSGIRTVFILRPPLVYA